MRDANDLREAIDLAVLSLMSSPASPTVMSFKPALFRGRDHLPGIAIVDVDHRRAVGRDHFVEQPQLGGEVVLEGRVIIQMVAGDIGEGAGRDPHAVEPVLVEAVAGRFERQMRHAVARQLVQRAMQLDRIGRGVRAVCLARGRHHADRAEAGGRHAERRPDLAQEGGDRGFAVGAGDGGDGVGLAREKISRPPAPTRARGFLPGRKRRCGQSVRPLLGARPRTAPAATACLAKCAPSVLAPAMAANRKPGLTLRLSAAMPAISSAAERGSRRASPSGRSASFIDVFLDAR